MVGPVLIIGNRFKIHILKNRSKVGGDGIKQSNLVKSRTNRSKLKKIKNSSKNEFFRKRNILKNKNILSYYLYLIRGLLNYMLLLQEFYMYNNDNTY